MNGNVSADSDWLPRAVPIQARVRSTASRGCRWTVHTSVSRRREDPDDFFFFFLPSSSSASFFSLFASVREPSGDQLVTRRPWVSTREYGGWDRAGDRGGDGDKPEMVKEKQRGASFFNQVSTQLPACAAFPPLGLLPENVAPALHCRGAGASVFSPRCPRWSKFVFCFFLF